MYNENLKKVILETTSDLDYSKASDYLSYRTWNIEKDRILFVTGEINGDDNVESCSTETMIIDILRYNKIDSENGIAPEERQPIVMYINSQGGDSYGTYTLTNVMDKSVTPITTVNIGEAASNGGVILAHGHHRIALPGTRALVHSGSFGLFGNAEQAESAKKVMDKMRKRQEESLLSHTKITKKDYAKYAPKDWWFFDEEQLEYGLVDEITADVDRIFAKGLRRHNVEQEQN